MRIGLEAMGNLDAPTVANEDKVFDDYTWNAIKTLAEQNNLPVDSQSIADAETLVLSHHPAGDMGVVHAVGELYGEWSSDRIQAAVTLADLYRAGNLEDLGAHTEAADEVGKIEIDETPKPDRLTIMAHDLAVLAIDRSADNRVGVSQQTPSPLPQAQPSSGPKLPTAEKRLAKARSSAGDVIRADPQEIINALGDFDTLETDKQHERVVELLAKVLKEPKQLVEKALNPHNLSRPAKDDERVLLKIRNAIGFIPNKKLPGNAHLGILPHIQKVSGTPEINRLLANLLGFQSAVEGKPPEIKRTISTTKLRVKSMGVAMKSPYATSEGMARRGILKGLMIIGLYKEAERAGEQSEVAS